MTRTLLLADDSVTIQRVIELTFADEDIRVIAVGDGQQAIARIDADRPDVVLADVGMPERDGYEVAAHIKGNPELAHIPVLLLTGAFEPVDDARARQSGCDGVLVKPFEPQMVINRVKDLLAGRRPAALWSAPPVPAAAAMPAAAGGSAAPHTDSKDPAMDDHRNAPEPARPVPSDGLDDYFDRLDAAFSEGAAAPNAGLETPIVVPQAQPAADMGADFGSWDLPTGETLAGSRSAAVPHTSPREAGDLSGPAPADPGGGRATATAAPEDSRRAEAAPDHSSPALADAFAALLSAEQRVAAMADQPARIDLPEGVVDEIVRRVLSRMTDETVRATVLDVAERLVREEIDKIKNE